MHTELAAVPDFTLQRLSRQPGDCRRYATKAKAVLSSCDAWQFHDGLVRRWFDASYQRQAAPDHIAKLTAGIGLPITPWFEHWISFVDTTPSNSWFTFRDDLHVARMSQYGVDSVSILMQGECDVFWCIDIEDWCQENPEVMEYTIYGPEDCDEDDNRLYDAGATAPFLAAFALCYQLTYLNVKRLASGIEIVNDVPQLTDRFVRFGNLHILETSDTLIIRDDDTHYRWGIAVQFRRHKTA